MPSIIPEPGSGGVVVRGAAGGCQAPVNVSQAYCPGANFTSSCAINYLPNDCTARITAAQINAFQSEMLALAECFDPDGNWNCGSLTNLCTAFSNFRTGPETDSSSLIGAVSDQMAQVATMSDTQYDQDDGAVIHVTDGNGDLRRLTGKVLTEGRPVEISNAICADPAAIAALQACIAGAGGANDGVITGLAIDENGILTATTSLGGNVTVDLTSVYGVADGPAQPGVGQAPDPGQIPFYVESGTNPATLHWWNGTAWEPIGGQTTATVCNAQLASATEIAGVDTAVDRAVLCLGGNQRSVSLNDLRTFVGGGGGPGGGPFAATWNDQTGELTLTPDGQAPIVLPIMNDRAQSYAYGRVGEQPLPSGVDTTITGWNETYDPDGVFDAAAGTFTVTEAGFYNVSAAVNVGGLTDTAFLELNRNGAPNVRLDEKNGALNNTAAGQVGVGTLVGHSLIYADAGDVLSLTVFQNRFDGGALGTNNAGAASANYWSISRERHNP